MTPAARKELPEGWRWVRLAEVIREAQGGFASGERDPKGVVQLRMNNVTNRGGFDWGSVVRVPADRETIETYRLLEEDVVFNNTNSTELVGKTALFEAYCEPVLFSNHFTRLRTIPELLTPPFLAFWLQERWQRRVFADICNRWIGQSAVQRDKLLALDMPLPPLAEQKRIAGVLSEQVGAVERPRAATEAQLEAAKALPAAYLRQSLAGSRNLMALSDCLIEVSRGIGSTWSQYRVLGATRAGLALAKERVGKHPERYKLVDAGTIFYNPMRILLGSIAMVDEGDETGITSPDYVVLKTKQGVLHPRWFYYWLRSPEGDCFVKTLTRGAVRERMLFRRLAEASIELPPWSAQTEAAAKLTPVRTAAETMAQQLAAINALPAALLRRAFSGEL